MTLDGKEVVVEVEGERKIQSAIRMKRGFISYKLSRVLLLWNWEAQDDFRLLYTLK